MKVLGIIPARGGSKGVPGKNIRPLNGKPLIVYTIEAALASRLTDVIVSTDDDAIANVAREAGANVPFRRPAELSGDSARSIPVAQHALKFMEEVNNTVYDAIMLLQPTAPFRTVEDINRALDILEATGADSVISVQDVEAFHPARMKYLDGDKLIDPPFCEAYENQGRQELRPMYIRNGAIYLTRRDVLLGGSYKGNDCRALIMPPERSVNIDSIHDFEYAEWVHSKYLA
ncbi:MAG TPA: acylneuraminate cytidylyltransferase family protein [Cyclobacteriaceae bacterium]|jgi:CMP-N,N'-diacetyllegionaminic acid synthase|nr:acylneuraminate cytidylyltransferase family protein [Cyclobacteriaceae bacterium]